MHRRENFIDFQQTIFPSCDDETKELTPIVFHVPATYNKKVKVHGWEMHTLAEPRDNKDIFPPHGTLHQSSYQRLGPDDGCTGISETQAMLSQIELKHLYDPVYPQRALLNIKSLAAEEVEEKKESSVSAALYDPEEARCMDYRTTMELDYRLYHPIKLRPPPPPPPQPWLLNRRTIGYSLEQLEKRPGTHTFLDDNMELHRSIAELKSRRHKVHEILYHDESVPKTVDAPVEEKEKLVAICN